MARILTISLGTGLSYFSDHSICSSETICLVRGCPLQTASDRAVGHATGTAFSPSISSPPRARTSSTLSGQESTHFEASEGSVTPESCSLLPITATTQQLDVVNRIGPVQTPRADMVEVQMFPILPHGVTVGDTAFPAPSPIALPNLCPDCLRYRDSGAFLTRGSDSVGRVDEVGVVIEIVLIQLANQHRHAAPRTSVAGVVLDVVLTQLANQHPHAARRTSHVVDHKPIVAIQP
jgi:hypothetical protein